MTKPDLAQIQRTLAASDDAVRASRAICAEAGKTLASMTRTLEQANQSYAEARLVLNEMKRHNS